MREFNMVRGIIDKDRERVHRLTELLCERFPAPLSRELIDNRKVLQKVSKEPKFGRNIWGLLCLELWQQIFHDRESEFKHQRHLSHTRG